MPREFNIYSLTVETDISDTIREIASTLFAKHKITPQSIKEATELGLTRIFADIVVDEDINLWKSSHEKIVKTFQKWDIDVNNPLVGREMFDLYTEYNHGFQDGITIRNNPWNRRVPSNPLEWAYGVKVLGQSFMAATSLIDSSVSIPEDFAAKLASALAESVKSINKIPEFYRSGLTTGKALIHIAKKNNQLEVNPIDMQPQNL